MFQLVSLRTLTVRKQKLMFKINLIAKVAALHIVTYPKTANVV